MDERFKHEVETILRWRNLNHLKPMYTNLYHIPERVYEYNKNLFVVFNTWDQKYEIHSIEQGPKMNSRQVQLEFDDLDCRALQYIWENDLRVHGQAIFDRLDKEEEDFKKRKDRQYRSDVNAIARETRHIFAKAAGWGDGGQLQFQGGSIPEKKEVIVNDTTATRNG